MKNCIHFILFWLSQMTLQAQTQLDWLLKQEDFKPILADHLKEVNGVYKSGTPNISVVLFKPDADTLTIYLTAITYLSEVKDHLPASFTMVSGQPFLVYDGSELLIEDKQTWFEVVRAFIGNRLCDDLEYRELLKKPGPRELRVPCSSIYDATVERLLFKGGRLAKRKQVGSVPYYLE